MADDLVRAEERVSVRDRLTFGWAEIGGIGGEEGIGPSGNDGGGCAVKPNVFRAVFLIGEPETCWSLVAFELDTARNGARDGDEGGEEEANMPERSGGMAHCICSTPISSRSILSLSLPFSASASAFVPRPIWATATLTVLVTGAGESEPARGSLGPYV